MSVSPSAAKVTVRRRQIKAQMRGANTALAGSMAVQMVKTSFLRQAVDG
jgi:hypothetical protein